MKNVPVRFYILGDIKRPDEEPDMPRMKAERIIRHYSFDFSEKSEEELKEMNDSVCVAHLDSRIIQRATRDVDWIFDETSLYQTAEGIFFAVNQDCAPFAGGSRLMYELNKDYFEKHNAKKFCKLNKGRLNLSDEDMKKLFAKREITFYAERWLSFDFTILFDYLSCGHTKAEILEKIESYKEQFSKSPDKEKLYAHLEKEAEKALKAEESNTWPKDDFLDDEDFDIRSYNPLIAEYED